MGQSHDFTRNLLLTAAALQVAHARQNASFFSKEEEARRLLELYPGSGMTVRELVAEMERMSATPRNGRPAVDGSSDQRATDDKAIRI